MLSICVLHYGQEHVDMTAECLETLKTNTHGEFETLLWINGGIEEPYNAALRGRATYAFGTNERLSLAAAYNEAVSLVNGDMLAILHNDCFVPDGWNVLMEAEAAKGNIAFPKVRTNEEMLKVRGLTNAPEWMPPSCCFVMQRADLDRIGGWDEQFTPCHYEDMDLFKRATDAGMRLVRTDVSVFHVRGATRADDPDVANAALRDNAERFARKHGKIDGDKLMFEYPKLEEGHV